MSTATLACARATRAVRLFRHRDVTRALSTEASTSSSSSSPVVDTPPPAKRKKDDAFNYRKTKTEKTVYVRSWDEIGSMPEFFAMLRGLEHRFGRVREFRVQRDHDVSTVYHNFFMVHFAEDEAYERVPEKGTNIRVEVPIVKSDRPGGIGLADLTNLLQPQDRDAELDASGLYGSTISPLGSQQQAEPGTTRVVELIVERAKRNKTLEISPRLRYNPGLGVAFYRWGGFYTPSSDERPVSSHMLDALDKWGPVARKAVKQNAAAELQLPPLPDGPEQDPAQLSDVQSGAIEEPPTRPAEVSADAPRSLKDYIDASLLDTSTPSAPEEAAPQPSSSSPSPAQTSARLSRKQKILALARENARAPLLDGRSAEERRKAEAEAARRKVEEKRASAEDVVSMRDRLLKLMSGKWM